MYNQIILIFIIFIIILYCLNKCEHFSNKIVGNKDVFLPYYDLKDLNNIKINKICIKNEEEKIECLTKEQLFNALELPIFRKHAICIDDACVSKNNLLKINKDNNGSLLTNFRHASDKCFNIDTIKGTAGAREQKKWEKDTYGKVKYNLLNRPAKGWKKKRSARQGKRWCNKNKYRSLEEYGCKAKPRYSKGSRVCWASSGGLCLREFRKKKRRMKRRKNDSRIISSIIPYIPVLKENECNEDVGFKIKHGDLIGKFNFINIPLQFTNQQYGASEIAQKHEIHSSIK